MDKPVLVIMAAGMGSRYGGLKQIDPLDEQGHILMDFSLYDARQAGFEKVVFIIRREHEEIFREAIGDRISKHMEVAYAFQDKEDLPAGYTVPEGREKPWGTGHAVLSCRNIINGPFAVINADDYYGREAFALIYDYLVKNQDDEKYRYAMVGYRLGNTLSDSGHVSRGICETDADGFLTDIVERTRLMKDAETGAKWIEDDGKTSHPISPDSTVSMNLWGFSASFLTELEKGFPVFLEKNLPVNPLKCEYYLPFAVDELLKQGRCSVRVLQTNEKWFGMTYREDREQVVSMIAAALKDGKYPYDM